MNAFISPFSNPFASPFVGFLQENLKKYTFGSRTGIAVSTPDVVSRRCYMQTGGAISITSGTGEYRINGGSWVATSGTVSAGDYIEARQDSSANYETSVELVFSLPGGTDTYTVTTAAEEGRMLNPDGSNAENPDGSDAYNP